MALSDGTRTQPFLSSLGLVRGMDPPQRAGAEARTLSFLQLLGCSSAHLSILEK